MLSRKNRLTREAFNTYFKKGKRFHGTYVQLVVAPSSVAHGSVVVGKKVYTHAVDRNLLRRRLYPLLRTYFKTNPSVCIVITKPAVKSVPFSEVKAEVESLLQKVS
jgi:ribonuclease P protein component